MVGQVCFVNFLAFDQARDGADVGRDCEIAKQAPKIRDQILCRFVPGQSSKTAVEKYYAVLGHHKLTTNKSDVIVETTRVRIVAKGWF